MFFPFLYIGSYLWTRTPFIKPEDMDFKSGLAEVEAASYDEPPPRNWVERIWMWLVRTSFRLRVPNLIIILCECRCESNVIDSHI